MRFAPVVLAQNKDMSSSFTSTGIDLNQIVLFSIQAVWTGSPNGTLFIEVSDDIVPIASSATNPVGSDPAANVVNWSTYTGSQVPVTTDGNFLWNVANVGYRWVRMAYTASSGSGSLTASYSGKGV